MYCNYVYMQILYFCHNTKNWHSKKGKQNFLESAYHSLEFAYLQLQLPYCLVNTSFVMKSYTYGTRRAKQWQLNNDIKMPFDHALFSSICKSWLVKHLNVTVLGKQNSFSL